MSTWTLLCLDLGLGVDGREVHPGHDVGGMYWGAISSATAALNLGHIGGGRNLGVEASRE